MIDKIKELEFESFLKDEHAKNYTGLDDDMPDSFENWLTNLEAGEYIDLANKAIKTNTIKLLQSDIERLGVAKTEETDYRNDEYGRGMEAGRNYFIDSEISLKRQAIEELKNEKS